jgi:hypothetical protein
MSACSSSFQISIALTSLSSIERCAYQNCYRSSRSCHHVSWAWELAPDPGEFKSTRHFAAWIGLTPRSHSSGGNKVVGHISKMGNRHLRSLLVVGAMAVLHHSKAKCEGDPWLLRLKQRPPFKVVAVALANKTARIIWALLMNGGIYTRPGRSPDGAANT